MLSFLIQWWILWGYYLKTRWKSHTLTWFLPKATPCWGGIRASSWGVSHCTLWSRASWCHLWMEEENFTHCACSDWPAPCRCLTLGLCFLLWCQHQTHSPVQQLDGNWCAHWVMWSYSSIACWASLWVLLFSFPYIILNLYLSHFYPFVLDFYIFICLKVFKESSRT